jgi:uncharacterized protein
MASRYFFRELYMQPTTLCNLDCSYCYLPERKLKKQMAPAVAAAVAESLDALPPTKQPIGVKWHCGEPLACPREDFAKLFEPFRALKNAGRIWHRLQTNATLIDDAWCELLLEHGVQIGVSIDGPAWANSDRRDWSGRLTWDKTMRGLETLKRHGIPLSVLVVVTEARLGEAKRLYDFFCQIGCQVLGVLIEERLDNSGRRSLVRSGRSVAAFWSELAQAWQANPVMRITELDQVQRFWKQPGITADQPMRAELLPSVGWDGDLVMLAPELLQQPHAGPYGSFSIGNVLETPFLDLVARGKQANYVLDFVRGLDACKESCSYYTFCRGAYPANRFFEHGHFSGTETAFCRNSRKHLLDACASALDRSSI